jgi:Tfp pilus assembly protein PilO
MSLNLRNPRTLAVVVVGGALLLCVATWVLLVSPQRTKATKLDADIVSQQQQIDESKAALQTPKANLHVKASDVYRLTRAMPNSMDMSGIILTLNQLATAHHLQFASIQPNPQVTQTGFNVQPAAVQLQGRFSDVSSFLGEVRKLVDVKKHQLKATGRLFSVDSIELGKPDNKLAFPIVKATLTIDAFTFVGAVVTPPSDTTQTAPSGTVAAGANP